ncbi:FxLYD domain-containing protein [Sporohalobacter salinus]|uniref:FxLYD domain-containing protein n=1 Tax=Sporohalobacter salinus TaxID=1494606 RepID=UPI00196046DA|nr:FxLYD domain-containing protein [Sporohalobacter salinus]MBM7623768.1 hypothetical protein [Sporohalobacter salinus]
MKTKIILLLICLLLVSSSTALAFSKDVKGGDFEYDNTSIRRRDGYAVLFGEMTNETGKDYELVKFTVNFYNWSEELINSEPLYIENFNDDQTKSFEVSLFEEDEYEDIDDFKIQFEGGIR